MQKFERNIGLEEVGRKRESCAAGRKGGRDYFVHRVTVYRRLVWIANVIRLECR